VEFNTGHILIQILIVVFKFWYHVIHSTINVTWKMVKDVFSGS